MDSLNESFEDFVIESGNEDEEFENNENDELERNENADLLDTDAEWSDEDEDDDDGDEARGDERNTSAWSYKIQRPVRPQFSGEHGANLNMLKKCKTDLDYYNLFFPDSITSLILSQSDIYGSTKTQNFMSICKDELMIFLAMLLQMGYMCRPKMEDYWTTDIAFGGVSIFKDVMPKKRFKDILRSLHFADNNNNSGSRLYKIEKLVEIFNNVCQSLLRPGEKVCIDESIIPFRGRLAFRQYIPNKRHRYGIKLFKLCTTSGYTYNTMIYCGKSKNTTCSVGEAVVTELAKDLFNEWRTMYVDNWYSSVNLAETLLKKKMNLVGTLRKNRKNNPKAVTTQKLKKGQVVAQQNATGVRVLKWLDKREVLMISTMHNDARADNGKPVVVFDYNQGKSFVDLSDQMHSYQAFERKTYKWYIRIFFHLVTQVAVTNAWILRNLHQKKKVPIIEFKKSIVRSLRDKFQPKYRDHYLRVVPGGGTLPKRRCVECYRRISAEKGSFAAQTKAKRVNTRCSKCNQPYCLECFQFCHSKC